MKGSIDRLLTRARRRAVQAALGAAALAGSAVAGHAQQPALPEGAAALPLSEGTRVRVRAGSVTRHRRIEGSILRLVIDTVVVDTAPEWKTHRFFGGSAIPLDSLRRVPIPVDSIRELQVSSGRSRLAGASRWVLRGAIVGGIAGALANTPQRNPTLRDLGDGMMIGVPVGAAIGLVYGMLNPGERWRSVPLRPRPARPAR